MATSSALDMRKHGAAVVLEELPARYRGWVLAAFPERVQRIVLFGSRARGEPHAESDWDFAVFLDHEPTPDDELRIREVGSEIWETFNAEVQAHIFAPQRWLATDELVCNIRDEGLIIHGPDHLPMIERPVLEHARAALAKAERFAGQAAQAVPQAYETVVHNSYYAMLHAARAALLAVDGSASTNHGRVVETFARMVRRRRLGRVATDLAKTLSTAYKLRAEADYSSKDLTEAGRQLREQVRPFLELCLSLVDQSTDMK